MIVPMKKIFLIMQDKDAASALKTLCEVGTLHVEHQKEPVGDDIHELQDKRQKIEKVLQRLSCMEDGSYQVPVDDSKKRAVEVFDQINLIAQLQQRIYEKKALISKWETWGNFDPRDILALKEKGIHCSLAEVDKETFQKIQEEDSLWVEVISSKNQMYQLALFSKEEREYPFDILSYPQYSLDRIKKMQEEDRAKIHKAERKIREYRKYFDCFQEILAELKEKIAFKEAYYSRTEQENLSILKGFCPKDKIEELSKVAKKEKWGLVIEQPAKEDQVPTLIRNPKWVEVIKPVFQMINILPGYEEMDISMVFLLFFSVFFGILIGDAGYGLVFFLGTLFVRKKRKDKQDAKNIYYLMYVLSICAVIWGALTGVFFGQQWLSGYIKPLMPWLTDIQNIQMVCFFIGAVHLSIAHLWRAILKAPSLSFLSQMGWIALVWGMFFLARVLILGEAFPPPAKLLFALGFFCVIFFTKPSRNVFKTIGSGVGDLLLNVINTFTDIVSYIRLFAVGLASIAVADAFNDMALSIGFSSVFAGFISAVVLVVGHLFNVILGAMAILVHGLRLNVLEFSNHLNMEWSGFRYNPFRKIKKVNQS